MIQLKTLSALTVAFGLAYSSPVAHAQDACDISQTKCALNGGKCNIKFRNRTADNQGSGGPTDLNQRSYAMTIKVKALKANGDTAGNVLTIDAGASKTMNIEKKANKSFAKIRLRSSSNRSEGGITMNCDAVKAVLNGNGTCKVFHGAPDDVSETFAWQLGYNCDGGNVYGPGQE